MDETYRMLGREHEADLEREARRWQRAATVKQGRGTGPHGRRRAVAVVAYVGSLMTRKRVILSAMVLVALAATIAALAIG